MVRKAPLATLLAIVAAQDDKAAAVNKVIKMLENLQEWCVEEGEKEAKSYNTFACYCKETTKEKAEAIQSGEDEKDRITADIEDGADKRDELDEDITDLVDEIAAAEKELKEATEEREKTLVTYEKNEEDLAGAIAGLEGAIKAMKAGKGGGKFVQLDSMKNTMQQAVLIADALGIGGAKAKRAVALFVQSEAGVPTEKYSYHGDDIISTLEGLETDFKSEKDTLDSDEEASVTEYKALKKGLETTIKNKNEQLVDTKKERDEEIEKIAENSEELTASAAVLLDDQQYMTEVSQMCSEKAQTWDQRNKVRADELSALTAAIDIMKDKVSDKTSGTVRLAQQAATLDLAISRAGSKKTMEEVEAEAEEVEGSGSSALSFLQKRISKPRALLSALTAKRSAGKPGNENAVVIAYLSQQGKRLKSTLLTSLASQIRSDPFAKVKKLIQELVERLLSESADEANQKGFCDKALSDARQKRDLAAEEIAHENTEMSQLEALDDKLTEELDTLAKEIAELEDSEEETTKLRKEEKAENEATVEEAKAGLEAVEEAIDILDKFYKTASKEEVELEFVQGSGPADDAPDTGFDSGEAYTGNQGGGGGVLGMMDVIKSDFERTVKVTEKAEADAEDEYRNFMTETGKSLAEKEVATEERTKQKDNAQEKFDQDQDDLNSETEKLKTAITELLELKPTCIDTGMSYEDRVAAREDEIEALKKALCIFDHMADEDPAASC